MISLFISWVIFRFHVRFLAVCGRKEQVSACLRWFLALANDKQLNKYSYSLVTLKIAAKTSTRVKGLITFLTPLGLEPHLLFDMAGGFKDHRAFHTSGGTGTLGEALWNMTREHEVSLHVRFLCWNWSHSILICSDISWIWTMGVHQSQSRRPLAKGLGECSGFPWSVALRIFLSSIFSGRFGEISFIEMQFENLKLSCSCTQYEVWFWTPGVRFLHPSSPKVLHICKFWLPFEVMQTPAQFAGRGAKFLSRYVWRQIWNCHITVLFSMEV